MASHTPMALHAARAVTQLLTTVREESDIGEGTFLFFVYFHLSNFNFVGVGQVIHNS